MLPLWQGRIYQGKLCILDGDPGCGKTMMLIDLCARLTTGGEMPDGTPGTGPCGVIYFTAEDDPADTLRPRHDAAGGDPSRFLAVTMVRTTDAAGIRWMGLPTLSDSELIERAIHRVDAKLVIFDPFAAYLDRRSNSWRDQDVRAALVPLARLAERTGAAVVLIRHLNKTVGGRALYRGGGSIGNLGTVRSGLLAARCSENDKTCALAATKNNLGPPAPTLLYTVVKTLEGQPRMRWGGVAHVTADDLVGLGEDGAGSRQRLRASARAFLRRELAAGPRWTTELQEHAEGRFDISKSTLKRAAAELGVVRTEHWVGGVGKWSMHLPEAQDLPASPGGAPDTPDQPGVSHSVPAEQLVTARGFLEREFAEGPQPVAAVFTTAAREGISREAIHDAREQLGLAGSYVRDLDGKMVWVWALPAHADWPSPMLDAAEDEPAAASAACRPACEESGTGMCPAGGGAHVLGILDPCGQRRCLHCGLTIS